MKGYPGKPRSFAKAHNKLGASSPTPGRDGMYRSLEEVVKDYYGGLAALAAFELIDWPVAVVIAAGHLMASNHHNKLLEELGEAIEEAE